MKSDPTFDRRKYLRVQTESLLAIGRLDAREALAHSLDVSLGGIRFQCMGLGVQVGDILRVSLTLATATTTVLGQLVRVNNLDEFTQDVALCFVKMDDATRERLERHLPPPEEGAADDRRRYSRVPLESVVAVSRATLIDVIAQARDLSLGGVRFVVDGMELQLGDALRVTLDLEGETVTVVGQLVRITELDDMRQEVALAFLEADDASLELLRRYLPAPEDEGA